MVSVLGSASGVFAVSAQQFQSKAQGIWQGLKKDAANGGSTSTPAAGIQDFIDPDTRARLAAQKQDTDSLVQKLASGGEDAKEAAARKKEEAKQKLKMLKLQAQLAAASGDKKAAARIAKEAATVAKELGQATKAASGDSATATGSQTAAGSADAANASAEAQAVAQDASQTASQGGETPPDGQGTGGEEQASVAEAGTLSREEIQARSDAIVRDGAARAGEAREESELRGMMDQLRAIHQQMKNLARKDGSPGTKAEMERASQDMEEGDRAMADAFGPPGVSLPGVSAVTAVPVSVDIRV